MWHQHMSIPRLGNSKSFCLWYLKMVFRAYKLGLKDKHCVICISVTPALQLFFILLLYIITLSSFSLVLWQASEELCDMLQSMLIRIRWAWTQKKHLAFYLTFDLWNYSHLCIVICRKWAVMTTCGPSSTCWLNSWLVNCPGGKLKTKYGPLCISQYRFVIYIHICVSVQTPIFFPPLSAFRNK